MDESPWVSTKEASEALEVSERTIRRWCADGTLRSRKQGKAYLVEPAAMEKMRQESASSADKPSSPEDGLAADDGQKEEETPATPAVADAPPPPLLKEEGMIPQVPAAADTAQPACPPVRPTLVVAGKGGNALAETRPAPVAGVRCGVRGPEEEEAEGVAKIAAVMAKLRAESQAQAEREKTDRAATERQIQREQVSRLEAKVRALEREKDRLHTAMKNIRFALFMGVVVVVGGFVLYEQWDRWQEVQQEIREEGARRSMEARLARLELAAAGKSQAADSSKVAESPSRMRRAPIRKRF